MQQVFERVINNRGCKDPYKRQKICAGQHTAAVLLLRTVLQQRANRHNKETAKESRGRQENQHAC